jgi:hypothetical protein
MEVDDDYENVPVARGGAKARGVARRLWPPVLFGVRPVHSCRCPAGGHAAPATRCCSAQRDAPPLSHASDAPPPPGGLLLRCTQSSKAKAPPSTLGGPLASGNAANAGRSIEQVYQKKSQLEHILLRPDTYIGSVEKQTAVMWVHAPGDTPGGAPKLEQRSISYVPGLYKIFDEILVNAADNKVRDPSMTCVRVDVDPANGTVRVYNDGDGIPVEVHKEEQVYVPELIFGHLLTSSNYDDTEKKVRSAQACSLKGPVTAPVPGLTLWP